MRRCYPLTPLKQPYLVANPVVCNPFFFLFLLFHFLFVLFLFPFLPNYRTSGKCLQQIFFFPICLVESFFIHSFADGGCLGHQISVLVAQGIYFLTRVLCPFLPFLRAKMFMTGGSDFFLQSAAPLDATDLDSINTRVKFMNISAHAQAVTLLLVPSPRDPKYNKLPQ